MASDPLSRVASWLTPVEPEPPPQQPDDSVLVSLFHRWVSEMRALEDMVRALPELDAARHLIGLPAQDAAFEPACRRVDDLERAMADTPSAGLTGFAVKVYVAMRQNHVGTSEDGALIGRLDEPFEILDRAVVEEMGRLVPELS